MSRALRDLGRLVKTQFILRWIENPDYRRRIHRQLNKGEALHALRRFLFFAHEGKVQRRQADQQTNQVLCLNLVTNERCCMDRGGDGIRPFPSGSVRHVSIARSEYLRWPPRGVRRGALHTL